MCVYISFRTLTHTRAHAHSVGWKEAVGGGGGSSVEMN